MTNVELQLKNSEFSTNDDSPMPAPSNRQMRSNLSVCCILTWPLICSITVLFFSTAQDHEVKKILSIRALMSDITQQDLKINETYQKLQENLWEMSDDARRHSNELKHLKEGSRSKFIRLKGIPEEPNEKTDEKIAELLQYLGFMISEQDIEKANRVGSKDKQPNPNQPRVIIAELTNYKLKINVLREAATKLRHTPYSILDDETFVMVESDDVNEIPRQLECGIIQSVSDPVTWKKAGRMFGFWGRDADPEVSEENHEKIWVMEHFYRNTLIGQYDSLVDFLKDKTANNYTVPYNWAGTGHTIYKNAVYFNKFNTSVISKYDFSERRVVMERSLPNAGFGNMAPYQWAGSTDFDISFDECGLWIIYATLQNSLDIGKKKYFPRVNVTVLFPDADYPLAVFKR